MSDYVGRLQLMLESLIDDLDDKVRELDYKKEKLERVSRFVAYTNGDVHLVGIYADQELIYEVLETLRSNKEEYRACCYLLESDDENIHHLPQYEKATVYITKLINYFKKVKANLIESIAILEKECQTKRIEKKYFNMFSDNNLYVEDVEEYEKFLDEHDISEGDKEQLLLYAIKKNVERYQAE